MACIIPLSPCMYVHVDVYAIVQYGMHYTSVAMYVRTCGRVCNCAIWHALYLCRHVCTYMWTCMQLCNMACIIPLSPCMYVHVDVHAIVQYGMHYTSVAMYVRTCG